MSADNFHFVALSGKKYAHLSASSFLPVVPLTEQHLINAGCTPSDFDPDDPSEWTEYGVLYEKPVPKEFIPAPIHFVYILEQSDGSPCWEFTAVYATEEAALADNSELEWEKPGESWLAEATPYRYEIRKVPVIGSDEQ